MAEKAKKKAKRSEPSENLYAVERAARLLILLSESSESKSLSQLARTMQCSVSTIHRIVSTLTPLELIERDPRTGEVRLGLATLRLGNARVRQLNIVELARPLMQDLRDKYNETVTLWVRRGHVAHCIAVVEASQEIRQHVQLGMSAPLIDFGAKSRILLASLPNSELENLLAIAPLKELRTSLATLRTEIKNTSNTLVSHVAWTEQNVSSDGFPKSIIPHVNAVATGVRNSDGEVSSAIAIAGPSIRFEPALMKKVEPALKSAAAELSRLLGWTTG